MRRIIMLLAVAVSVQMATAQKRTEKTLSQNTFSVEEQLTYCDIQVTRALGELRDEKGMFDFTMQPRNILVNDRQVGWNCRKASAQEWCSGFWPGILWMDFSFSHNPQLRQVAEKYTESLSFLADQPAFDHDLGFLVINSFLKGYEQTYNPEYKRIALAAADTLATLYNPMVGTILSWPRHVKDYGGHNTIMDNMINLELLFWAADHGGSPLLRNIAISHAKTTMQNHFRSDGTCYHVAVYDPVDGHFIKGVTHQGFADGSTWARGQSWAVYGYTMVYRFTRNPVFLEFAQKVTDAYIRRLTGTPLNTSLSSYLSPLSSFCLIPRWDFDAPGLDVPKDASAACVVASALLELSQYVSEEKGRFYRDFAIESLRQLSTPAYQSREKNVAFLMHSTGHHPAGSEIDASIIYADYYYIEALLRLKELKL
ncbi:MAG: glycoside hydrolase family 88 protein [Prevotella sp.]|nr:glycoside hydrolase family 88 protein [Prevotella sp.]